MLNLTVASRCGSAWKKDPAEGVIGVQSGPRRHRVPECSRDHRSRVQDAGRGDDREDPSRVLRTAQDGPGATVERNSALSEKIPDGGLIILRDGDPGEPEQMLGGFGNAYYQHAVEIEVYLEEGDAAARDAAFDNLLQRIGAALESDPTLGGLAFSLTYGRPEPTIEAVAGAPAIKRATLSVTIDYETDAPLA
jgi:hypothetical protein